MEIVGIIAEYNPFHNGHKYQIDRIKKIYPDALIIVCLSCSFTQRGDISILNKFDKTKIALEKGADIVIELPYVFSSASADIFGKYAVRILNYFNIDYLCFGSESCDINVLKSIASVQINNESFDNKVKLYIDKGINYPTAVNNAVKEITGYEVKSPNDLLAISYIKSIIENGYDIKLLPIQRTNDYHDNESDDDIVSASNIRNKMLLGADVSKYVPECCYKYLNSFEYNNKLFELLKYKIISDNDLSRYVDVDEGIDKRIKKVIHESNTLDELIMNIKSKRYTYNKINRMLCHILCSFTKDENNSFNDIEYIRVLGFSIKGKNYISEIKNGLKEILLNSTDIKSLILDIEMRVTYIYSLIYDIDLNFDKSLKPIIKTDE